ncbi:MAG: hypothetical protein ACI8XU_002449 [Kiritimatiellia bacterium]|jgi:hypothetical protein
MRITLKCAFFSRFTSDSLSRLCSQIRIFEGAILHDEHSLSINILGILPLLRSANGQKSTLCLCHNSDRSVQAFLQPRQRRN